jgi:hypothetical protein
VTDDIVAHLRVWSRWLEERVPDSAVGDDLCAAADEIERLRVERDEARWRLCKVVGDNRNVWGCVIAKENGWDYLATEETEATDGSR